MEGKTIRKEFSFNQEYSLLIFDDGTAALVKVADILSESDLKDLIKTLGSNQEAKEEKKESKKESKKEEPKEEKKASSKKPEPKPEPEEEPEEEEESITREDIIGMDFEELTELCKDGELDTDPDDFTEDEELALKNAILKELDMDLVEEEPEDDDSSEPDDDTAKYDWPSLLKMDYQELSELCEEEDLDTEPTDFDEDEEVGKFRKAIAKELGIEIPAKPKK